MNVVHRFLTLARVDDIAGFVLQRVIKRDQRTDLDDGGRLCRGLSKKLGIEKEYCHDARSVNHSYRTHFSPPTSELPSRYAAIRLIAILVRLIAQCFFIARGSF